MSLLRKYYKEELGLFDFDKISLSEREMMSKTMGYEMYVAYIPIQKAWDKFKDSLFESIDNRFYSWLLKMWFKMKGIK